MTKIHKTCLKQKEKKLRNKLFSNFPPRQEFRQESCLKSQHFLLFSQLLKVVDERRRALHGKTRLDCA